MNPAQCSEYDYINFLIAAQSVFSTVEAARSATSGPAHDAYTRLLKRLPPDSEALWGEVAACIDITKGVLVIDDTTLDKPYSRKMALVTRHWSGKHHAVVQGINLVSMVWTTGNLVMPVDYRLYNKDHDGLTKNDHFRHMIDRAHERGFTPALVAFDSWYSGLDNLKHIRDYGWEWLTRVKHNRTVSLHPGQFQAVSELDVPQSGLKVHLRGYGFVRVFRTVDPHGNADHWMTNRLEMTEPQRRLFDLRAWLIEVYHRAIKQHTGIERGQFRLETSQRNHIGLALRAYVRLEWHREHSRRSIFHTKLNIIRRAVGGYMAHPTCALPSTA
jgi:hypothetical protein